MNDYLTKPIDPTLLDEMLRRWAPPDRRAADVLVKPDVG